MYFDAILKLGLLALLGGILTTIYLYGRRRQLSPPEQTPSFLRYFGLAILVGIAGYIGGTAIGIYFACSAPTPGNLCGLYGALGIGPLVAGLALFLYGLSGTPRSHGSTPVAARAPGTAGWRSWTEHPLVRALAGLAGAGLALYGATALLDGDGRGAAAAAVIGGVGVYWGVVGRPPSWFRPR